MRNEDEANGKVTSRRRSTLARDALVLVAIGVALGAAFNHLERSRRPPRGLPWIAKAEALPSLERPGAGAATERSEPASDTLRSKVEPGVARRDAEPERAPVPAGLAPSPARDGSLPAASADSLLAPPRDAGGFAARAGLPVIPDLATPIAIGLGAVSRFVEAEAALVVDAREPVEFARGHIPGAVNVPYDEAVRDPARVAKLDPAGRPVIVYCGGGTCEASRQLAELLVRASGLRRVLVYEEGFPAWVAAGKPVSGGTP